MVTPANKTSGNRVHLELKESGVAIVRLGAADEGVITFTSERMESLAQMIESLAKSKPLGLIITGPGEEMFCAGADVNLIRDVSDPAVGERAAKRGQEIFGMIEKLPFPTVAAISGPCVGGGCELALGCTYRLITDSKNSAIGLPEIRLGILPGFGGTQRLPRLIGLPRALDIILAGKIVKPAQAVKVGLVHEVVAYHGLLTRAESILLKKSKTREIKLKLTDRLLTFTGLGRGFVAKKAAAKVAAETKGFYPAPPAALESAVFGLGHGMTAGLAHEAKELGRLISTPESKSLTRIFFLTESAKSIGRSAKKAVDSVHAVVVGAGAMGAGIAGSLARNDAAVILKDTTDAAVARGMEHIKKQLAKSHSLSEQERSFILNRIEATAKDSPNISNANLVIEAVFEDLGVKRQVLSSLAAQMAPEAVLATNTSSLPISQIAEGIPHPERVVGMHFFNPVEKMPLVEIVRGKETSDKTVAIIAALTTKLGKYPIVVSEVPGFLVNRILTPYLAEAGWLLKDGFSIADIDRAATSFGMPMGPVRLLDEVGLDVAMHVSQIMVAGYGDRMKGPGYEAALVAAGRKGRKNGMGFYDFSAEGVATPFGEVGETAKIEAAPRSAASTTELAAIQERLILRLVNEAVSCFDEGVAGAPSSEAANQVDLGSVMGFGFPPFRGGVLYYAQSLGAKTVLAKLQALEKSHGARFAPARGIIARASGGGSFIAGL